MPCTTNCNQGRACDCVLDAEGYLTEPEDPPMTRGDMVLLFLAGGLCGGLAVLIAVALGALYA